MKSKRASWRSGRLSSPTLSPWSSRGSLKSWRLPRAAQCRAVPREPLPQPPADARTEEARTRLAVVPPPDQPELPIPSPALAQQQPIALVRAETTMAEVTFVVPQSAIPANETKPAPPAARPVKASTPTDPLAAINTLSEEERLALFT